MQVDREIVVPASPERAFEVFTARMTDWWPARHHIGSAPIAEIVIEPREHGRWYTRHEDGTETSTGFVLTWDPPRRLVITWQISADWKYDPALITTVELNFFEAGPQSTRVTLQHRDLERYGEKAQQMVQTFNDPGAWTGTLEAYLSAF